MQTDRHGHPPIEVSSCPVGDDRKNDPYVLNGLNVYAGQLTYYEVGKALGSDVVPAACADGLKRKRPP